MQIMIVITAKIVPITTNQFKIFIIPESSIVSYAHVQLGNENLVLKNGE